MIIRNFYNNFPDSDNYRKRSQVTNSEYNDKESLIRGTEQQTTMNSIDEEDNISNAYNMKLDLLSPNDTEIEFIDTVVEDNIITNIVEDKDNNPSDMDIETFLKEPLLNENFGK